MLRDSSHKANLLFFRINTMEAMKIGLKTYMKTNSAELLETIKELGKQSQWYKDEIDKLK